MGPREGEMLQDSLYMENLREFVEDEDRIVSYKWLSRKLEVPVDAAKQMLYAYVEQNRLSGEDCATVIYTITGLKDTGKGKLLKVCLVRGEDLEAARKGFDSVRSVHVYSVQKAKIKDSSSLFTANYDICKEHISTYSRWSPISCSVPKNPPSSSTSLLSPGSGCQKSSTASGNHGEKKNPFPQLNLKKRGREQGMERECGGGGDNLHGHENVPQKETVKSSRETTRPLSRKTDAKKGGGGRQRTAPRGNVASLFSQTQTVRDAGVKSSHRQPGGRLLNDSDIEDGSEGGGESVIPHAARPTTRKVAKEKSSTKDPEQRKRKRIQNTMSSDEEGGAVVEKEETERKETGNRRKRVKRLRSKMYTADDGSMVTEKVWESESTDESDSNIKPTIRADTTSKKAPVKPVKSSPAKATRQSLLLNFFKK